MALPKIMAPTFELKVPSTGEMIHFRPFLVKEEKILLIARESEERSEIMKAIKQIVDVCVEEDFDVKRLSIFDLEYIFIKIRSKSVNNILKFQVTDPDTDEKTELEIDLEDVEVNMENLPDKKIMIEKDIGIMMKYPDASMTDSIGEHKTLTELTFFIVNNCVDYVFDGDEVYPWIEQSPEEREKFLDSIPVNVYETITDFFEKVPSMYHEVKYKNSKDEEKTVVFRNLDDFFALD